MTDPHRPDPSPWDAPTPGPSPAPPRLAAPPPWPGPPAWGPAPPTAGGRSPTVVAGLTVLGIVVLVVVAAVLSVVVIGTTPTEEDADPLVPVESVPRTTRGPLEPRPTPPPPIPDRPPPTTLPDPRMVEGLPALPLRDLGDVPGADPADFCPTGDEVAFATGLPIDEDGILPRLPIEANGVLFDGSACAYPPQAWVSRTPDPDRLAFDALRRSVGEEVVREQVVDGRAYLVIVPMNGYRASSSELLFVVGSDTYRVLVHDRTDQPCPLECADRVADLVVARAS